MDKRLAMAYVGEALAYKQPLWQTENVAAAQAVLARMDAAMADNYMAMLSGEETQGVVAGGENWEDGGDGKGGAAESGDWEGRGGGGWKWRGGGGVAEPEHRQMRCWANGNSDMGRASGQRRAARILGDGLSDPDGN